MKTAIVRHRNIIKTLYRIDPSFHLSDAIRCLEELENLPYECVTIDDVSNNVFLGNIFSRVFVKDSKHGMTYLAASDTILSDINTGKYLSNKQVKSLEYLQLKKDWILITCSGTLGNVTYTNSTFENKIATHDLIRIIPSNNIILKGVLYAFLSSKYGYNQLTQPSFGGVVKHINVSQTCAVKIPKFPIRFQKEVDDLIQESARLREEATDALDEAHRLFKENISLEKGEKRTNRVSIQTILHSHNCRFEGSYFTSRNRCIYNAIIRDMNYRTLGELSERIFRPGIFKRDYVKNGVTFLGGADILMAIPDSYKQLSFKQVQRMPELKVKKGWFLVTCGGTIGNTVFIDSQLEKCVISQHVMRIVPKEDVLNGYLYAVLSSDYGHQLFNLYSSGSVIPQIEAHHIERIPIPMIEKSKMETIDSLIYQYVSKIEQSKEKEIKAISLVESEIEKWNKN